MPQEVEDLWKINTFLTACYQNHYSNMILFTGHILFAQLQKSNSAVTAELGILRKNQFPPCPQISSGQNLCILVQITNYVVYMVEEFIQNKCLNS